MGPSDVATETSHRRSARSCRPTSSSPSPRSRSRSTSVSSAGSRTTIRVRDSSSTTACGSRVCGSRHTSATSYCGSSLTTVRLPSLHSIRTSRVAFASIEVSRKSASPSRLKPMAPVVVASSAGISSSGSHSSPVTPTRRIRVMLPSACMLNPPRATSSVSTSQDAKPGLRVSSVSVPGLQVEPVEVVQLGVVGVHRDEHRRRVPAVVADDLRLHLVLRREQPGLAAGEVERVEPPVLVTSRVLQVDQVAVVMAEQVVADAAVPVVGDRHRRLAAVGRPHPDVQDAVLGGDEAEPGAVGGQRRRHPVGVAEQHRAGDQRWKRHAETLGDPQTPRGPSGRVSCSG